MGMKLDKSPKTNNYIFYKKYSFLVSQRVPCPSFGTEFWGKNEYFFFVNDFIRSSLKSLNSQVGLQSGFTIDMNNFFVIRSEILS